MLKTASVQLDIQYSTNKKFNNHIKETQQSDMGFFTIMREKNNFYFFSLLMQ